MFLQILTHTPKWVFALFAGLVFLGIQQMLPRRVGLNRITLIPLAMAALSLYGVISAFGNSPQSLLTWVAGTVVAFALNFQIPASAQIQYDATNRLFLLPGSKVPLALFMGIFFTKYAVGASMGMQPSLPFNASFMLIVCGLYGAFSGIFLGRAAKLWRIALAQTKATSLVTTG